MKSYLLYILIFFGSLAFFQNAFASDSVGSIDPSYKYAWGENIGWINLGCSNCSVQITDTSLTGYAWSDRYGWINLSPTKAGVTNNCSGQLGGYAWSSKLGWINFSGASIDFNGKFNGIAGSTSDASGRLKFDCANCNVQTDWRQCSQRASPAQVKINSIVTNTVPSISADVIVTNEGSVDTEYQYEWCVVSNQDETCGSNTNVFYASAAKLIQKGQDWDTVLSANVPNAGSYWFKFVVHYGANRSSATMVFNAVSAVNNGVSNSGAGGGGSSGGGGGGGGSSGGGAGGAATSNTQNLSQNLAQNSNQNNLANSTPYTGGDFRGDGVVDAADFSILLYFWGTKPPFKNPLVDMNHDGKVNSVDFSIFLYNWGKKSK